MSTYLLYEKFKIDKNLALKEQVFDVYDNKTSKLIAKAKGVVNNSIHFSITPIVTGSPAVDRDIQLSSLTCELMNQVKVMFFDNITTKPIKILGLYCMDFRNIYTTFYDAGMSISVVIKHKNQDLLDSTFAGLSTTYIQPFRYRKI